MAVGLGENTPIKLSLTRENFNALIGRHAQPIRWLVSAKCPCITDTQKVDPNCPYCKGNGQTYSVQTESTRVETITAPIDGVIPIEDVIWVRDFSGNEYTITSKDCYAYVDGVLKGRQYQVMYKESVKLSGSGTATYIDDKLYRIDLPVEIQFGTVYGDLLSVSAKANGSDLTVTEIFRNCFEISDDILPTDVVTVEYEYVNPFQFALINNNFSKEIQKFLVEKSGDGIMIFPQRWEVDSGDIVVALNSTQIHKEVVRCTGTIDTLPNFYLYELKSSYAIRNDVKHEFIPYVDYVLYKSNQIKWISANKPTPGEQVSFSYAYNTVYKVMQDQPDPRTSENNRFPRKVALKLMAGHNRREGF
jgi:hypothetical protein